MVIYPNTWFNSYTAPNLNISLPETITCQQFAIRQGIDTVGTKDLLGVQQNIMWTQRFVDLHHLLFLRAPSGNGSGFRGR